VIRPVASIDELAVVFNFVFAQMSSGITHEDRRYQDLARRFDSDRSLMLVIEDRGRIVGGALTFNTTLRAIALEPAARGKGLGRRLLETIEQEVARLGRGGISLGVGRGPSPARAFFTRMGYSGRSRMGKQLSMSPHIRYAQGNEWRNRLEELRVRRAHRIGAESQHWPLSPPRVNIASVPACSAIGDFRNAAPRIGTKHHHGRCLARPLLVVAGRSCRVTSGSEIPSTHEDEDTKNRRLRACLESPAHRRITISWRTIAIQASVGDRRWRI
jgi:GNAT superfamily N-acetyltransferase